MAEYKEVTSEVMDIAHEVIRHHHKELLMEECRIVFIFQDEASIRNGKTVIASVTKISPALQVHLPYDFIIKIAENEWSKLDTERRRAVIDHELCHIYFSGGWKLRAHDVEEFKEIIERYGLWNSDLMGVSKAIVKANEQLTFISVEHDGHVATLTGDQLEQAVKMIGALP